MSSRYVGIEEGRKTLGDLVTAVQQGAEIILTRNGRPAARITAHQEDSMATVTDRDARQFVITAIEAGDATRAEFDIDAIIDELHELAGSWAVEDVETETFWAVVAKHARSQEDTQGGPTHVAQVIGDQLHIVVLPAARQFAPSWEVRRTIKLAAASHDARLREAAVALAGGQYAWVGPWVPDAEGVPTLELVHAPTDGKRRGPVAIVDDESYDGQEGLR